MNKDVVFYYVGCLFIALSFFMLIPCGWAFYDKTPSSFWAFAVSSALSFSLGLTFCLITRRSTKISDFKITRKEAFGIVAFGWLGLGVLCGFPFLLEGSIGDIVSSTFEAISGLTTTGATVFKNVESLSQATNLWRVLLHWIGGMGIVVLFVAIFPQLGLGGKHLFKTEVAGPINESLKPRIKQTAIRLWWIYMFFTLACFFLLWCSGLTIFESLCHSLSTLSTGGFSTQSESLGAFENPLSEWVVIFFMLAGGLNFSIYYSCWNGRFWTLFKNTEVQFFLIMNLVVALVIFILTADRDFNFWFEDFRDSVFQTVAVTTTTGLMTDDFDSYPVLAKYLLFLCMFIGGCAGSTAGGIKVSRVIVVFKRCIQELRLILHPKEVISTKLGHKKVSRSIMNNIFVFISVYMLMYLFGVFAMLALGLEWESAASCVVAALSSVGPGFSEVGPTQSYDFIPSLGKLILCFYMIAGRLEILVLLTLLTPSFWTKY